jgi:pyridoxine 5-phosphate synthase
MARLSVNLNKIALLRNSRHTGVPDVVQFARVAIEAGVAGITVHPRPDQRHIRRDDVPALANLMQPKRPKLELNIEGYPDQWIFDIVKEVKPEQCTLVPDSPSAFTSEKGWDLDADQMRIVRAAIGVLRPLGSRVIVFVDPNSAIVEKVIESGADGIEIYTGTYAAAFRVGNYEAELAACIETAKRAKEKNLVVNIGHDLNLHNLPPLVSGIPLLDEASIGHELTTDALLRGFGPTIQTYSAALAAPAQT